MLLATLNESTTLSLLVADGRTDLFGQARVYSSAGALVQTIDLNHVFEGLYASSWVPNIEGYFSVVYQIYFDAGRTVDAGYDKQGETVDVNSFRTNILKVLGLVHDNSVIDLQNYNSDGHLIAARIRSYNSSANAALASASSPGPYNTGLIFTWQVEATYSGDQLTKYAVTRA